MTSEPHHQLSSSIFHSIHSHRTHIISQHLSKSKSLRFPRRKRDKRRIAPTRRRTSSPLPNPSYKRLQHNENHDDDISPTKLALLEDKASSITERVGKNLSNLKSTSLSTNLSTNDNVKTRQHRHATEQSLSLFPHGSFKNLEEDLRKYLQRIMGAASAVLVIIITIFCTLPFFLRSISIKNHLKRD